MTLDPNTVFHIAPTKSEGWQIEGCGSIPSPPLLLFFILQI